MMHGWQDILALTCVALATSYIAWRAARKWIKRSSSNCGGCASCPASEAGSTPQQLVTLAPPTPHKPGE